MKKIENNNFLKDENNLQSIIGGKKGEFIKADNEENLTIEEKSNMIRAKENYHNQGLKQAKIGFYYGLTGAGIGLLVIISAIFFADDKMWGAISGGIIEAVSLLIFKVSDKAIERMGNFFDKLGDDSNKIKAIDLTKGVKSDDIRDELSVKLALFLVGIDEEKICKHSKNVCQKKELEQEKV
ncbi:TRADD-N-associated membrane domain-containing protein [Clostridium perfringens]